MRFAPGARHSSGLDGLVCCDVGTEQYALRGSNVKVVARAEQMDVATGGAQLGTLRHRGETIPVFGLAALLDRAANVPSPRDHIVVSAGAAGPIGLLVDRLARLPEAVGAAIAPLPPVVGPTASAWFEGLVTLGDRACLVVSPAGLDPSAPPALRRPSFEPMSKTAGAGAAADIVVVFSSPVLPAIGVRRYALSARLLGAVVQSLARVPLPAHPPCVKELASWRDAAVPVLDFSTPESAPRVEATARASGLRARERYLVVGGGSTRQPAYVAFAVDDDVTLHRATREDRLVASPALPEFVRGVFAAGGENVALLDLDALLVRAGAPSADAGARVA